jgi:hypothetical protein
MVVTGYGFLPGQPWLYLSAYRLYEAPSDDSPYHYDLWLLNSEDSTLRRLTPGEESWDVHTHSPEGANLFVTHGGLSPQRFSLVDGSITTVEGRIGIGDSYVFARADR